MFYINGHVLVIDWPVHCCDLELMEKMDIGNYYS